MRPVLPPPVRVVVELLEPVRVDREGITEREEVVEGEVEDGAPWRVVVEEEVRVEAPLEEEAGRGEEELGGWCNKRNLMLEAVRKQEM